MAVIFRVILLALFFASSYSFSQSLGKLRVDRLKKSVVRILIEDQPEGTGFFVTEDGWVLTCYHVIVKAISFKDNGNNTVTYNFKKTYAQFENGEKVELAYSGKIIQETLLESIKHDYFLLKIQSTPKTQFHPLKMGKYSDLDIGDKVYTAGYPLGLSFLNATTGETSSIIKEQRTLESAEGKVMKYERKGFFLDLTINGGNSGGPLIKIGETPEDDLVVGVITYKLGPMGRAEELKDYYIDKIGKERFDQVNSTHKISDIKDLTNDDALALLFSSMNNISIGISGAISIDYALLLLK